MSESGFREKCSRAFNEFPEFKTLAIALAVQGSDYRLGLSGQPLPKALRSKNQPIYLVDAKVLTT
jgi:hypothetical protein